MVYTQTIDRKFSKILFSKPKSELLKKREIIKISGFLNGSLN